MCSRLINMAGERFGKLSVIKRSQSSVSPNGKAHTVWECLCDCGNIHTVFRSALISGNTRSCGCGMNRTHGMSASKEYSVWEGMKQRCDNPNSDYYKDYGGRGISYDSSWSDFSVFYEEMGDRPDGMSLDRINVNGDYCKENCRWASGSIQSFNRRSDKEIKTGVRYVLKNNKYHVRITKDYREIHLGCFDTYDEAVKVREEAEMKYFGFIKK